jgi:hypothetical protein
MSHEEERAKAVRTRNKPERAPPHWLNPFVGDGFDGHNQNARKKPPQTKKLPKSITRHHNGIPTIVSIT